VTTKCTFHNGKIILTGRKSFCDRSTVVLNLRKTALFLQVQENWGSAWLSSESQTKTRREAWNYFETRRN